MDNTELVIKGGLLMVFAYTAEDYFRDKISAGSTANICFSAFKTLGAIAVIYGAYGLLKK